ncbi:hypothetical protein DH2020_030537 [Rehmannia glutinosa]|uniref:Uncharacterized protein n=1 Tax=Rehmannia glutinosa TaxID=99300 RepID=A0ABR0VP27_REHGL
MGGAVTQEPTIDTRYKDPKQPMNTRIKSLVAQMTLKEKIGQMAQIDRVEATPEIMREFSIGSIISAAGSTPHQDHRATPEQWVDMVNEYQNGSLSSRLGIPMLYAIDSVHGHNSLYKATLFLHNVGLGATRDPELVKRIGAATAVETRATGIPYAFSPCIAVCRDPRWGRCYESYSEDHKIVEQMTDIILGLQGEPPSNSMKGVPYIGGKDKVVACAKHFVGDGGTIHGIDENNTLTDWKGMLNIHMPGYYHSIIKGVSTIMVSYSSWNGVKMHSNRNLITQFLKTTLKFRGVDRMTYPWGSNYSTSLLTAINAGVDMVMVPPNHTEFLRILTSHVNNKLIPMSRIDDAIKKNFEGQVRTHKDLAREAVRKSLVLLKNGKDVKNHMLPLPKKTSKILVVGTHANNLGLQCGGWTITWQGLNTNNLTTGTTILNAISATVDPSTEIVYSANPDVKSLKANEYPYAIVVGASRRALPSNDGCPEPRGRHRNEGQGVAMCSLVIMVSRESCKNLVQESGPDFL